MEGVLIIVVIIYIFTAVEYFIFNKTNSFFSYLILGTITEFLISIALSYILGIIIVFLI